MSEPLAAALGTSEGELVSVRYYAATGAASATAAVLRCGSIDGHMTLLIAGESEPRHFPVNDLKVSERFSQATRIVQLPDGAVLEVSDGVALSRVLAAAGRPDAIVTRWQHSWRMVLGALLLSVALVAAAYVWALPVAADYAARRIPASWTTALDDIVIGQLKLQESLKPSELSSERQHQLRLKFEALAAASASTNAPAVSVHFYRIGTMPNAFALPGGSIVFLDGLIAMAPDDDALAGVFAHELGHAQNRHGLRTLLRTAAVSAVAAWYFGDLTSLASAAVLVSQLSYSRAFETAADDTAIALMQANHLDTQSLAELFRRMRDRGHLGESSGENEQKPNSNDTSVKTSKRDSAKGPGRETFGGLSIPEFLSTHPDIDRRIERFGNASKSQ